MPKSSSGDENGGILSPPLSPVSSNLPLNQGRGLEAFTHTDYFSETQATVNRSSQKKTPSTPSRPIEIDDDPMKESTLLSITGIAGGGEGTGGATSHANVSHTIHTITTRHSHW